MRSFKLSGRGLSLLVSALVIAAVLSGASGGAVASNASSTSGQCSPQQLENAAWSSVAGVNKTLAVGNALASNSLQQLVTGSSAITNLIFNSVYFDWNLSSTECSAVLDSVNVDYDGSAAGEPVSIVVSENPGTLAVTGAQAVSSGAPSLSHSSTGEWSGYGFHLYTVYPNLEIYAQWYVPYVNYPSWGCPFDGAYFICDISPWAGLTAESNGGNGIAQAGTDSYVHCTLPFGLGCGHSFDEWYEFYPSGSVDCISESISPGDSMESFVAYDSGTYYTLIEDTNNGHACGSNQGMSMGEPYYAEEVAENPGNPLGGVIPAPDFGQVNFFDSFVGNVANLNNIPNFNYGPGDHVSLPSSITYPGGYSGSGFNVYQT